MISFQNNPTLSLIHTISLHSNPLHLTYIISHFRGCLSVFLSFFVFLPCVLYYAVLCCVVLSQGSCANAPMVQMNDDYYECLTPESTRALLDACKKGQPPKMGKWGSLPMNGQVDRHHISSQHRHTYIKQSPSTQNLSDSELYLLSSPTSHLSHLPSLLLHPTPPPFLSFPYSFPLLLSPPPSPPYPDR